MLLSTRLIKEKKDGEIHANTKNNTEIILNAEHGTRLSSYNFPFRSFFLFLPFFFVSSLLYLLVLFFLFAFLFSIIFLSYFSSLLDILCSWRLSFLPLFLSFLSSLILLNSGFWWYFLECSCFFALPFLSLICQ